MSETQKIAAILVTNVVSYGRLAIEVQDGLVEPNAGRPSAASSSASAFISATSSRKQTAIRWATASTSSPVFRCDE
jgi:hypothetical protein